MTSKRGAWLLAAIFPALGSCRESLIDESVKRDTFGGYHLNAFEAYVFRPCGNPESGWLEGDEDGTLAGRSTWVRFKGYRVGPGRFGHVGGSEYLYVMEEVLAVSPDSSERIC